MKRSTLLTGIAAIFAVAAPLGALAAKHPETGSKKVTLADGLSYTDSVVGKGALPKPGEKVTVDYVGTLTDGKKFDASADHGGTFSFTLGQGEVIKGWDEGVATMRVGGKRRLVVPPALGYGDQGAGDAIPPGATLIFDITLISIG